MLQTPPLGLYIHLPWCVRKCPYCDFNSHQAPALIPEDAYIAALLRDLAQDLRLLTPQRPPASVFFGGGTPSLFSPESIDYLLQQIDTLLPLDEHTEITLEANPGTVEQGRFEGFRRAGVNRLSLGVQSLHDDQLKQLGRIHGRTEALAAVAAARGAGFENINLDMMFALPGQSQAQALEDLDELISLAPEHISYYQLTLEPDTVFARHPPVLPDDDTAWAMQVAARRRLGRAGYRRYEVSAYGQPDRACQHNLNYWRFGDYIGIGAGAHGKHSDPASGQIRRRHKPRQPRRYLQVAGTPEGIAGDTPLSAADRCFEFMLNALRLSAGVPSSVFSAHTGLALETLAPARHQGVELGLLHPDPRWLRPTARGRRFLNDLVALFLQ